MSCLILEGSQSFFTKDEYELGFGLLLLLSRFCYKDGPAIPINADIAAVAILISKQQGKMQPYLMLVLLFCMYTPRSNRCVLDIDCADYMQPCHPKSNQGNQLSGREWEWGHCP